MLSFYQNSIKRLYNMKVNLVNLPKIVTSGNFGAATIDSILFVLYQIGLKLLNQG